MNYPTRVLFAMVAAAATFSIVWLYANRIDLPLLLSEGAFFIALICFHPDRQIALVLLIIGVASVFAGIFGSMSWPRHSSLMEAILLDPSISMICRGRTSAGYAFLICGAGSYL